MRHLNPNPETETEETHPKYLDVGDFFTGLFVAVVIGLLIIGPLATGIGFIFCTFLQAIGIGIVSFVVCVILMTAFIAWNCYN